MKKILLLMGVVLFSSCAMQKNRVEGITDADIYNETLRGFIAAYDRLFEENPDALKEDIYFYDMPAVTSFFPEVIGKHNIIVLSGEAQCDMPEGKEGMEVFEMSPMLPEAGLFKIYVTLYKQKSDNVREPGYGYSFVYKYKGRKKQFVLVGYKMGG